MFVIYKKLFFKGQVADDIYPAYILQPTGA